MTLGSSHVHKARTVVNSSFSNKELLSLSGWSKSKIGQRFESSLACIRHRDHRKYAHKGVQHNGIQHRASKVDPCAPNRRC